jgi:putative isomerase
MHRLALLQQESQLAHWCLEQSARIRSVLEQRHWDEEEGFYYDWDVRLQQRSTAKNLDAFYYLYHAEDTSRVKQVMKHFLSLTEFGLPYPPTLSADNPHFAPLGYWRGSYWPREMLYIGLAFNKQGYIDLALREVLKALCSQSGCVIAENLHPQQGTLGGNCYTMAYSSCLNLALQEICSKQNIWL